MSQVIAIVNQKGGVAKTTTTVNLAAALSEHGEKVLCIDLDPQANLTMSLGCQTPDELPYTMADVIDQAIAENPIDPMQGVIHHPEGIDLMPSASSSPDTKPCSSTNTAERICFASMWTPQGPFTTTSSLIASPV